MSLAAPISVKNSDQLTNTGVPENVPDNSSSIAAKVGGLIGGGMGAFAGFEAMNGMILLGGSVGATLSNFRSPQMVTKGAIGGAFLLSLGIEYFEGVYGTDSFDVGAKVGSIYAAYTAAANAGFRENRHPDRAPAVFGKLAGCAVAYLLHSYGYASFTAALVAGGITAYETSKRL